MLNVELKVRILRSGMKAYEIAQALEEIFRPEPLEVT